MGRWIRTTGYLRFERELSAIFLSSADGEAIVGENGIAVIVSDSIALSPKEWQEEKWSGIERLEALDGQMVTVGGVVDTSYHDLSFQIALRRVDLIWVRQGRR